MDIINNDRQLREKNIKIEVSIKLLNKQFNNSFDNR